MLLVVATLNVSPSGVDEFEAGFAANASRVHAEEPGCLIYQLCKDKKKPGEYTVIEVKGCWCTLQCNTVAAAAILAPRLPPLLRIPLEAALATFIGSSHVHYPHCGSPTLSTNRLPTFQPSLRSATLLLPQVYADNGAISTHMRNLKSSAFAPKLAGRPMIGTYEIVGNPGLKRGSAARAIVAHLDVRTTGVGGTARNVAAFESVTRPLVNTVQEREPGCLMYAMGRGKKEGMYVFAELYVDKAAIGRHGQTEYFKAASAKQAPLFAGVKMTMLATVGEGGAQSTMGAGGEAGGAGGASKAAL
jgi:quinol monooxygenase YgiN